MTELDDRILAVLSDGRSRGSREILEDLFHGHCTYTERNRVFKRLQLLRERGEVHYVKMGNCHIYTLSGQNFDLMAMFPEDALIGVDFDPTAAKKDAVLQLLSDGEFHTTQQIARAYFERVSYRGVNDSYMLSQINKACNHLEKWGYVERMDYARGLIGWRSVA